MMRDVLYVLAIVAAVSSVLISALIFLCILWG